MYVKDCFVVAIVMIRKVETKVVLSKDNRLFVEETKRVLCYHINMVKLKLYCTYNLLKDIHERMALSQELTMLDSKEIV
jgi:hypothetical protein